MKNKIKTAVVCATIVCVSAVAVEAVTSVIVRQKSPADLLKGTMEGTVVDSRGVIRLAPKTEKVDFGTLLDDVWTINTVLTDNAGTIYVGTSPYGKIIRSRNGQTDILYPKESAETKPVVPADPNAVQETIRPGEHVFAITLDVAGRVLAGVSGQKGKLLRISSGTETLFENDDVQYIFAIVLDKQNNIYLATGPNSQLWRLDAFGQNPKKICQFQDKNILSLVLGDNDVLYAGSDSRGIVYRVDLKTETTSVLFDSEFDEITALVWNNGELFATASSADMAGRPAQQPAPEINIKSSPDRSEEEEGGDEEIGDRSNTDGGTSLKPANSKDQRPVQRPMTQRPQRPGAARAAGRVYRISADGFVTSIFEEPEVFYTMIQKEDRLLIGTGPKAKLFYTDMTGENCARLYEDKTSSQITAAVFDGQDVFLALANPPALIRLADGVVAQGTYMSDLIDARQPARWGKIQLDADIPDGCVIELSTRSGNVGEPNDSSFSAWTEAVKMTAPVDAGCPVGRFCQYRLTLKSSSDNKTTPLVREISVANAIPNLEPKVRLVAAQRNDKKPNVLIVAARAEDDNKDTLEYAVEFRKHDRQNWILLKDKLEEPKYEWDTRTVEDGRYEIRVTANDRLSNNEDTALSNSRISDPVVIDNTAPTIEKANISTSGSVVTLNLNVRDQWSVVSKVQYTVDSNTEWKSVLPDDSVFDTTDEVMTIVIPEMKTGEHVIAISVADDIGNTAYKSYVVEIK